ncbi:uncharacterized protein LOC144547838 [Carex rostrata]
MANSCLIQELPVEDSVLEDFIDTARKSMEKRMGNLVNQGGSSGINLATSHGASPSPSNLRELIDVYYYDGSPHHQVDDAIGQTRDSIGTLREEKDALKAVLAGAASAWEKEKAEVASLKAEQAHVASAWENEKAEVARLKGAASAWEKEKSELERKVEHLEEVLAGELYFQKEKERYEGLLQELKGQMQVAKVEREQAILALYEVESKLKGKRYKVGKSASEWKIPEHLTLPPSDAVLSTIRNSQAFAPFSRQIEKEILEHDATQCKITKSSNNKKVI